MNLCQFLLLVLPSKDSEDLISHVKILQAGGILVEDTTTDVVVEHCIGPAPPPHRSCFLTEAEC